MVGGRAWVGGLAAMEETNTRVRPEDSRPRVRVEEGRSPDCNPRKHSQNKWKATIKPPSKTGMFEPGIKTQYYTNQETEITKASKIDEVIARIQSNMLAQRPLNPPQTPMLINQIHRTPYNQVPNQPPFASENHDLYKFSHAQDIARIQANMLAMTPNPPNVSQTPTPIATQVPFPHRHDRRPTTNINQNVKPQQSQQSPASDLSVAGIHVFQPPKPQLNNEANTVQPSHGLSAPQWPETQYGILDVEDVEDVVPNGPHPGPLPNIRKEKSTLLYSTNVIMPSNRPRHEEGANDTSGSPSRDHTPIPSCLSSPGHKIQKGKKRTHPYKRPDVDNSSNATTAVTGATNFVTGIMELNEAPLESQNERKEKGRRSPTKRPSELFRIEAIPRSVNEYPAAGIMNLENENAHKDIDLLKKELKKWEKSITDLKYDDLMLQNIEKEMHPMKQIALWHKLQKLRNENFENKYKTNQVVINHPDDGQPSSPKGNLLVEDQPNLEKKQPLNKTVSIEPKDELTKEHRGAIVDAYLALTGVHADRRHLDHVRLVHDVIPEFRHIITPDKVQRALKILKKAKKKNIVDTFFLTGTASGPINKYFPLPLDDNDMRSLEEFQNDFPFKVKMVALLTEFNHEQYDLSIDTIYELLGMPSNFQKEKINKFLMVLKRAYSCMESSYTRDRPVPDDKRAHNWKQSRAHEAKKFVFNGHRQLCANPKDTCDVEPLSPSSTVSSNSLNKSTKNIPAHDGSLHSVSMRRKNDDRILGKRWKNIPIEKCVHLLRRLQGKDLMDLWKTWCPDAIVHWSPEKRHQTDPSKFPSYFPILVHQSKIAQNVRDIYFTALDVTSPKGLESWMIMAPLLRYLPNGVFNIIGGEKGLLCLDGGDQPKGLVDLHVRDVFKYEKSCWNDLLHHKQSMTVVCNPLTMQWVLLPVVNRQVQENKKARMVVTTNAQGKQSYVLYCVGGDIERKEGITSILDASSSRKGIVVTVYDSNKGHYVDKQSIFNCEWPKDSTIALLNGNVFWGARKGLLRGSNAGFESAIFCYIDMGHASLIRSFTPQFVDIKKYPFDTTRMEYFRVIDCDDNLYGVTAAYIDSNNSLKGVDSEAKFEVAIFKISLEGKPLQINVVRCVLESTMPKETFRHVFADSNETSHVVRDSFQCAGKLGLICIYKMEIRRGAMYDVRTKQWSHLVNIQLPLNHANDFNMALGDCIWEPSFSIFPS